MKTKLIACAALLLASIPFLHAQTKLSTGLNLDSSNNLLVHVAASGGGSSSQLSNGLRIDANGYVMVNVAVGGTAGVYTVSTLPTGVAKGTIATVTDAAALSDCTSGGGTTLVLCVYNGSTWQPFGGSSGGTVTSVASGTGLTGGPITGTGTLSLSPFATNGTNNTSAGLNFLTSTTNNVGLTATPSNPSTNGEKFEITGTYSGSGASIGSGTIPNGALVNPSITLNGTANQITSPGSTALGATATYALANPLTTPGAATINGTLTANSGGALGGTFSGNPNLSGSPTTTTQTAGDNSTKIATTAYIDGRVASSFTAYQPVSANSSGVITPSASGWDASKFPGATADVQLNTANAYALTTTITKIDASALNGVQTLAAQVNIGEFLPPTVSACTVGVGACTASPGAGTYRLVITFTSPTITESEASEEAVITITSSQGIQINAPTYSGTATSYNPYMTAAAGLIWTEVKCTTLANTAIASNAFITTTCGPGAVSKINTGVTLTLPMQGHWQCTITDGVHDCLKWFDHAAIYGQNAGYGQAFKIEAGSTSTNVAFICGSDIDEKVVGMYVWLQGFECNNNINGTGTIAGATDVRYGNVITPAVFMQGYTIDTSHISEVHGFNGNGANGAGVAGCAIYGGGAGTAFINIGCDGGGASSATGGGDALVLGSSNALSMGPMNFYGGSFVHPGHGSVGTPYHNINWLGNGNAVTFHGSYLELVGSACNAANAMIDIGTAANVGGPIKISDVYAGSSCGATVIQVESGVNGSYVFENIRSGSASSMGVNDLVLGTSSAAGAQVSRWSSGTTLFGAGLSTPYLQDANLNKALNLTATASAVDYLNVTDAAAANPGVVGLGVAGSDTNISLNITAKGTGTTGTTGSWVTGASPPACSAGTSGYECFGEGTDGTNVAGTSLIDANSTTHEFSAFTNGSTSAGMLVRAQPGPIRSTGLTASVSTATLCAAAAGACNVAGTYHVHIALYQGGTACTTNTTGGVSVQLTWTDANGSSHSAVTVPLITNSSLIALTGTMLFNQTGSGIGTVFGSGDLNIDTNGSVIQYATIYGNCSVTGTATYAISAVVDRLQ